MAAHLEPSLAQNGSQNSDTAQDVTEQSKRRLYYFIYRLGEVTRAGAMSIKSKQTLYSTLVCNREKYNRTLQI